MPLVHLDPNIWRRSSTQVGRLGKLLADRKVTVELTDAAQAWLGRVGYDPVYGARPLKRAVTVDEGDGKLELKVR